MSCVHPVSVLDAVFCVVLSVLLFVEDARSDYIMDEEYSRVAAQLLYR